MPRREPACVKIFRHRSQQFLSLFEREEAGGDGEVEQRSIRGNDGAKLAHGTANAGVSAKLHGGLPVCFAARGEDVAGCWSN